MKKYLFGLLFCLAALVQAQPINGPLRINPINPRYFTNNSGKAIYLVGSHTWENFQDILTVGDKPFDYPDYLNMMASNGHNFMRFWSWEQTKMASWTNDELTFNPMPFARTGPGLANDGLPKFDLTKFDQSYFDRMRERIIQARDRNIYAAIMLFQGWSLHRRPKEKAGDPFPFLPFNAANNINGISVPETNHDPDDMPSLHSMLAMPELLKVQEAYIKKIVETVNDLDNVLYEVINEGGSISWQYHVVNFVKKVEATMPKQHPIGMGHRWSPKHDIKALLDSPADWISPGDEKRPFQIGDQLIEGSYKTNPPPADGSKVIIVDTDHLWGTGGNYRWVWKSFMRGLNVLLMDPWVPLPGEKFDPKDAPRFHDWGGISRDVRDYPEWALMRTQMGATRAFAERIDLLNMPPRSELSSTQYCLANPGREYLIYFPECIDGKIDLRGVAGEFSVEWYIPVLDQTVIGPIPAKGGDIVTLRPPISLDTVLYLKRK